MPGNAVLPLHYGVPENVNQAVRGQRYKASLMISFGSRRTGGARETAGAHVNTTGGFGREETRLQALENVEPAGIHDE
jgi:hypothetical protein